MPTSSAKPRAASKSTQQSATNIHFFFMAISRKSDPCSGPRFHVYLPIDAGTVARNRPKASVIAITFRSFSGTDGQFAHSFPGKLLFAFLAARPLPTAMVEDIGHLCRERQKPAYVYYDLRPTLGTLLISFFRSLDAYSELECRCIASK